MRNGGETNSFVCFRGHCLQICLKYSVLEALYLCPCSLPLACCALRPSCEPYSLRFDALHALCALRFDAPHTLCASDALHTLAPHAFLCASRLLAPHTPRAPYAFLRLTPSCAPAGFITHPRTRERIFGHSPSLLMSLCQLLAQDNSPAHRPKNIL